MSGIDFVTATLCALAVAFLGPVNTARASDENLSSDLERIAHKRIFFGHQSVGMNLLDGVRQLDTMSSIAIRIAEVKSAGSVERGMIGHAFIAENGKPLMKLKSFEQMFGTKSADPDIALMKFCYVDFTAGTDPKLLFVRYHETIDNLKKRHPGTVFVHVTAPLTTVQGGFKESMRELLGRTPYGVIENMRREEYNSLLRQAYKGREPIFDIALIESTAADGTKETYKWKNTDIPVMSSSYTDDGGHLNDTGKLRAARELVSVLASVPNKAVIGKPTR